MDSGSLAAKIMGRYVSYPLELKLLKKSKIIATVSKSVADELKEYHLDNKNCTVIGNGVDETRFSPAKNASSGDYILFTGRLTYRKGLFDLIECAKYIKDEYPEISFVVVGKGNLAPNLHKKVEQYGLKEKFRFLGYVDPKELVDIYRNARMFVMPSHYEGLPTVLLEAMSCGIPAIATEVSGNLEVIKHCKNGLLIPPKSPRKMADAISLLLEDQKLSKTLGENARRTILENYTWDMIYGKYLKCYQCLLEDREPITELL
jgi:glycosyltransferase involved in cell wall biosynthesis